MGLNIKNPEVERLAAEVARMAGETKTEAIRQALADRKTRLQAEGIDGRSSLRRWLEEEVWPSIPEELRKAFAEEINWLQNVPIGGNDWTCHRAPSLYAGVINPQMSY